MDSDDMLEFYSNCWRDLRSVLCRVICDKHSASSFAQDILNVMIFIELIFEMRK